MANKMNNVTTLGDKERMHALLADNVDDDFDVDELINVDVQINPNNPTIENTPAITHNIVFLQFIQPISCNTENLMSLADLHPEADIVKILQLRLFLSAPLSASTLVVTLNTVFKLCFSNEEQISFHANRCLRDLLYCGEQWLCSSSSIQEVLSSMGTSSHISASRKDSTQWTTSLDTVKHSVHHICMCNQAMRRMRLLLELIHLSYSNFQATAKGVLSLEPDKCDDVLKFFELLLFLNCDSTIQEHFPHLALQALQAVMTVCRTIETIELFQSLLDPAHHVQENEAFCVQQQQQQHYHQEQSHHFEPNPQASEETEDTVLSQDMYEKATISPTSHLSSPPARPTNVPSADAADDVFVYSAEWLSTLPSTGMSNQLALALREIIQRADVSLHMLSYMSGSLSQHPDYRGLWRYFMLSVFAQRIAPFFPTLMCWPSALLMTGTSTCTTSTATLNSSRNSSSGSRCNNGSLLDVAALSDAEFVACIVATVQDLQQQYDTYSPTQKKSDISMWREVGDVIALFRLIHRYVLVHGEQLESVLLEDLEDACVGFKKTRCGETIVLNTIDMIKATCELYLDF